MTGRLKALIGFRVVFITLLLGSSYLFKVVYLSVHPKAISYFIIFLYSLTIIYSLLVTRIKNLFAFAYIQLVLDVFSGITLIYITGGVESMFSFTLILTVLSSSIVLNKKAGYVVASLSSILYGGLLDLQFYEILPLSHEVVALQRQFLYNVFSHILAFYITASLSGNLSSRLERTVQKLEEQDSHLKDVEFFNIKVIESLPSGLFTTDMDGQVEIFNRAAEKITEVPREEVIGGKIDVVMPFLRFPFREGRSEEVLELPGNRKKVIGINVSILKDVSGKETGYIGVFQDLTQLKTLEAEIKRKEKWATIGELSTSIAHEIRNPLASMRSSIEMLREEKITARYREKLMDIALKEMGRLNDIITDFLIYSTPKSLEIQRTDLHLLLDETLSLLKTVEQNAGNISIRKDFTGQLFIEADAQKIKQVFWNLGVNAIEAMSEGGELVVSTKTDTDSVSVTFSDTGAGMDASIQEKIFYPFFTTKEGGTGLGLAIAYKIIEEHEGLLTVSSVSGIGTIFEIILSKSHGRR